MESIRIQSADAACFSFQVRSVAEEAHELRCILYQRVSISRQHRLKQARQLHRLNFFRASLKIQSFKQKMSKTRREQKEL
jgi:hypothetical protein